MVLKSNKSHVRPGEPMGLVAYAQAFTGEVLSGTTASWRVSVTAAHYSPPNLSAYKFGIKSLSDAGSHAWESEKNFSGNWREGKLCCKR